MLIERLESKIKGIKTKIAENEKTILRRERLLNNTYKDDVIKKLISQMETYRTDNELLNMELCRYRHLVEYIKMHNRVTVAYAVYGKDGHRQRASWDKSSKFIKNNKIVEFLNSDITGHHDYTIIIITASTYEECESELYTQLSDGVLENCNYGKIVNLGCCDDFERNIEIMATIGLDTFIE